jgi:hypothetical protein
MYKFIISETFSMETRVSRIRDLYFEKLKLCAKYDTPLASVILLFAYFLNCVILSCQDIIVGVDSKIRSIASFQAFSELKTSSEGLWNCLFVHWRECDAHVFVSNKGLHSVIRVRM